MRKLAELAAQSGMTVRVVRPPIDNRCMSGHQAPEGVKFFKITSPHLPKDRHGVYCETCYQAAKALSDARTVTKKENQKISDLVESIKIGDERYE